MANEGFCILVRMTAFDHGLSINVKRVIKAMPPINHIQPPFQFLSRKARTPSKNMNPPVIPIMRVPVELILPPPRFVDDGRTSPKSISIYHPLATGFEPALKNNVLWKASVWEVPLG